MTRSDGAMPPAARDDQQRLGPIFVGIVCVEVLTIAALYWFGRHFS